MEDDRETNSLMSWFSYVATKTIAYECDEASSTGPSNGTLMQLQVCAQEQTGMGNSISTLQRTRSKRVMA